MNILLEEGILKPSENETLEHWIYINRKSIFNIHLKRTDANWKRLTQDVSEIFNLPYTLRTSQFIQILNSEFLFSVNQRLTYLL